MTPLSVKVRYEKLLNFYFTGTNIIGTPTMLMDIVNDEDVGDYDLSALKFCTLGGSPVSPSLVRQCRETFDTEVSGEI